MTLKEFLEKHNYFKNMIHILNKNKKIIKSGKILEIKEDSTYLDEEVISFGLYCDSLFIKINIA